MNTTILNLMTNLRTMEKFQHDSAFDKGLSDSAKHYLIEDIKQMKSQLCFLINSEAVERDRIANLKGNDNLELGL